ncbi:MAG: glycosyltransferase family 1 protein [Planctomycetota bacterium]
MPRIVVDLEKLRLLESGLGQYCLELGAELIRQRREGEELIYFVPPKQVGRYAGDRVTTKPVRRWQKGRYTSKIKAFANRVVPGPRYDLWHMTNQCSKYLPWNRRVPILLTIHDLNFLREKNRHVTRRLLREVQWKIDQADRLTTISEFVAGEVREHLDLRGKPLDVIYNGAADCSIGQGERPAKLPEGPFLFSLGCFLEKKNFHSVVGMMTELPEYRLVLAGHNRSAYGEFVAEEIDRLGVRDRVTVLGPISDAERLWCLQNCTALAFPSLTEGFGLPVVEAMSAGRPVFLSDRTSLPEIGGDVAFYWNRFEPAAMAAVVREGLSAVSAPGYGDRLRERAAMFRWQNSAAQYLKIYREMTGSAASAPAADATQPSRRAA